jgi:hypothetical protein
MGADETESWPLPLGESPVLDLDAGAIALEILPLPAGEQARIESIGRRDQPPPQISAEGGTAIIRLAQLGFNWPWGRGRHGSYRLLVPANVRARVRCAAGQIRVERLAGCDLDLATGAGQIALREVHGRLVLHAQAWEIRGERVGGTLQVESSLGSVRLEVDALDPGTHRIHSSMGSVRLELAEGLRVRIDAQTSMGSTRNRYPSTSDADTILLLATDLGSVRVDPTGARPKRDVEDWRGRWSSQPGWPGMRHGPPHHFDYRHPPGSWGWTPPPAPAAPPAGPPQGASATSGASDDELRRILTLVEQGKINAEQADVLIRALQGH